MSFGNNFGLGPNLQFPVNIEPFVDINSDDPRELLSWVKSASEELLEYYGPFRQLFHDNLSVYLGFESEDRRPGWVDGVDTTDLFRRRSGSRFNLIQPIVESYVSKLSSSRPKVSVLPVHAHEYNDLAAAKTAESLIEMSFRDREVDKKIEEAVRTMLICGSAYAKICWDPAIGAFGPDGQKVGDVDYKIFRPDQVLEQPGLRFEEKDWILRYEFEDIYKLEERYPDAKDQISAGEWSPRSFLGPVDWAHRDSGHQSVVFYFYHRATPQFPEGRYVVATQEMILEDGPLPYPTLNSYGMLPFVRLHDVIPPGYEVPLPLTVLETGKAHQEVFNGVNKNILRNMSLNTPKWIVNQRSGVRLSHLNNVPGVVQYKGDASMKPSMESPASTPAEYFAFRDQLMQEMQTLTGVSSAMGDAPPNTRAGVMLQHFEEQEFKRSEPLIKHVNDFQSRMGRLALAVMADFYTDDQQRMVKVLGGKSSLSFRRFRVADLLGPFDVKFERSSALPESKQGRLNEAARLFQNGLIDHQQYRKIIGYSSDPELATAESKAYEKQLLENDMLMRPTMDEFGRLVYEDAPAPQEWEDHVEHLKAIYPLVQSIEFQEAPSEVQGSVISHAMAHEMYAWSKGQVSLNYALKVGQLPEFPLFFTELPAALPISINNPPAPIEDSIKTRLETPGLSPSNEVVPQQNQPNPNNPEAV